MEKRETQKKSSFGDYLRQQRLASDITLREAARRCGVSAVYWSEVERGVRGPFKRDRWPALLAAIPRLSEGGLERHAAESGPVQFSLEDAPVRYQDLGLALARRIQRRDLSDEEFKRLFELLGRGDPDE